MPNSEHELEVMIPYFQDPESMRVVTQEHIAHNKPLCSAMTMLQFQSNGTVKTCWYMEPVGNIKEAPIRQIWNQPPHWWGSGCYLGRRMSAAEKNQLGLITLP